MPDLWPSWNREVAAHQAASVRAQGASPRLPQPCPERKEVPSATAPDEGPPATEHPRRRQGSPLACLALSPV